MNYERDDAAFPADAYRVVGEGDVAWRVLGWHTEPDEDTEWSGLEQRTGDVVAVMIGDDSHFRFEPDEIHPLDRAATTNRRSDMLTLKPGCGYWDCTSYPIGGSFLRAPAEGLEITEVEPLPDRPRGCGCVGKTADGRRVAFKPELTEEWTKPR